MLELKEETKRLCKELLDAYRVANEIQETQEKRFLTHAHNETVRLEAQLDDHTEKIYNFPWFRIYIYWREQVRVL